MKELSAWWREIDGGSRPWLLLGKGPSLERRGEYDLSPYVTVAINHVVREMTVEVTSMVNFDVLDDCGDDVYRNSRALLMPRYPHTIPGDAPYLLETYFERFPVLQALSDEGRLIWYNLTSDPIVDGSPIIENGPFSACILINLLGAMGAREARTLGIDGGQDYGATFKDLEDRTRLANGMTTYDYQFANMVRSAQKHGLHYRPLNRDDARLNKMLAKQRFKQATRHPRAALKGLTLRGRPSAGI